MDWIRLVGPTRPITVPVKFDHLNCPEVGLITNRPNRRLNRWTGLINRFYSNQTVDSFFFSFLPSKWHRFDASSIQMMPFWFIYKPFYLPPLLATLATPYCLSSFHLASRSCLELELSPTRTPLDNEFQIWNFPMCIAKTLESCNLFLFLNI